MFVITENIMKRPVLLSDFNFASVWLLPDDQAVLSNLCGASESSTEICWLYGTEISTFEKKSVPVGFLEFMEGKSEDLIEYIQIRSCLGEGYTKPGRQFATAT
jgi:hypothetical protein